MIQIFDKFGRLKSAGIPGLGTVTSISSGNFSPLFTVSISSPTTTPTLSFSPINQSQRLFYASPISGTGSPSFRAIQISDLPVLTTLYVPLSRTLTINGVTYDLSADRSWTIPVLSYTAENVANKVTNLTSPDNTTYPTTEAVANALSGKTNVRQVKVIASTTYTLLEEDKDKILNFTSNTDVTVTIPLGLTATNRYEGKQLGTGQVIFGTDIGVTLRVGASEVNKTAEQYSVFGLDVIGTEEYMLFGKLELV